jgi:hypothetical protein
LSPASRLVSLDEQRPGFARTGIGQNRHREEFVVMDMRLRRGGAGVTI